MYKVTIGLEVHCQLKTKSKVFSKSKNEYIDSPNTYVAPSDLGHPGTLPYPNKEAVLKALKTSIALNCITPDEIMFDRKNYFYPDLPKGYQITQVTKPMGKDGYLMIRLDNNSKKIKIKQLHLEEDTASLEHYQNYSLLDYNRSGIPLIEIVTEPCLNSSLEAVTFLETLRNVFKYLNISEADSKKGEMRCDVNISLSKDSNLGTKVEMKNLNSFTAVKNSIEYEIKRQTKLLNSNQKIVQETRRYSEEEDRTYSMREKSDDVDYKYFVDPNLPPVNLSFEIITKLKSVIPLLEYDRVNKYTDEYGLSLYDAIILAKEKEVSDYFDLVIKNGIDPKIGANWITTVILGSLNKLRQTINEFFITPEMLSEVIKIEENGKLSRNHAKQVLYDAMELKKDPLILIEEKGLKQIDDEEILMPKVIEAIDENDSVLKEYLDGKDYVANFFIGVVMSKTNRQANPKKTLELIKKELERRKKNE